MSRGTLEWKKSFDRRHGRGAFDRLVRLFKNNELSYEAIGEEFKVSRERVNQWRKRVGQLLRWKTTGSDKLKERRLKAAADRPTPKRVEDLNRLVSYLNKIGRSDAKALSFSETSQRGGKLTLLELDGDPVRVHWIREVVQNRYWRVSFWRDTPEKKVLFVCGDPIEALYLISTKEFLDSRQSKGAHVGAYIPVSFENFGYNERFPAIDWRDYAIKPTKKTGTNG